ncbi:hypothetical protein [Singulisphaera acidiphila]|uniref:Tetratricopeptide repeat protein n=1 Tax=Singulisphaera acidiphila (strain ATCC BAA-1392 / DSM 18658 / VKM B-2454 / MOB10) TaxID=886293 RepID=L0D9U1_SINAD|nr:hypothetical protein [Singulisphaera acidiphila]AGA26164.1 hypothetical protein Sinac_1798 [Singulisphaera acidiphila DSM 18658]
MSKAAARSARLGRLPLAALGALSVWFWGAWRHSCGTRQIRRPSRCGPARRSRPGTSRVEAELARLGRLHAQLAIARGRVDEAIADRDRIPDDHLMASQARLQIGQIELRWNRGPASS